MFRASSVVGIQGYLLLGNKRGCQGQSPLTGARGVLAPSSTPAAGGKKRKLNSPGGNTGYRFSSNGRSRNSSSNCCQTLNSACGLVRCWLFLVDCSMHRVTLREKWARYGCWLELGGTRPNSMLLKSYSSFCSNASTIKST